MGEKDPWFDRMRARFRLEHGLLLGGAVHARRPRASAAVIVVHLDRPRLRLAVRRAPRGRRRVAADRRHPDLLLLVPAVDPRPAPALSVGLGSAGWRRPSSPATAACGAPRRSARVPLLLLAAFYCLLPRFYYTGTDSVEDAAPTSPTPSRGSRVCVPGLSLPAGTAVVHLQPDLAHARSARRCDDAARRRARTIAARCRRRACRPTASATPSSRSPRRPAAGVAPGVAVPVARPDGQLGRHAAAGAAGSRRRRRRRSRIAGAHRGLVPAAARAQAQLPRSARARSSTAPRCSARASSAPWPYPAAAARWCSRRSRCSRCAASRSPRPRGVGRGASRCALFVIAAVNFALLGADHAGLSSARRGRPLRLHAVARRTRRGPSHDPASPLLRWSSAETLALEDIELRDRPPGRRHAGALAVRAGARLRDEGVQRAASRARRRRRLQDGGRARARCTTRRWPRPTSPPRTHRSSRS